MKVEITKGGLLIVPETEFEEQTISKMCPYGESLKAFLKCGPSASDVLGIKVVTEEAGSRPTTGKTTA